MWELAACIDGVNEANTINEIKPPSDEEFEQMLIDYDHLRGPVQ